MSITQETYDRLREDLIGGRWQAGERISINAIARQLGVSRTPVRDAVNQLANEGILRPEAKSGVVVAVPSYPDLMEIVEIRRALEPFATGQAAGRMTYDQLAQLRSLCVQMRGLARRVWDARFQDETANEQLMKMDNSFHRVILESAGNGRIVKIFENYHLLVQKVRYPSLRTLQHLALTLHEHWRIYRALAKGDVQDARLWMDRHTQRGALATLAAYREKEST